MSKHIIGLRLGLLACGLLAGHQLVSGQDSVEVPVRLILRHKAGVKKETAVQTFTGYGARAKTAINPLNVSVVEVPGRLVDAVAARLRSSGLFDVVERDERAYAAAIPNDSSFANQWHLPKIQAPAAWDITTGDARVIVAVVDSGVDPTHPDLAGKLVPGWNFLKSNTDTSDVLGHGTEVAGAAAAMSNNAQGVAGVSWNSSIMPLVVLNSSNFAYYSDIANAITYAADHGARVINVSIGGTGSSSILQNAVDYAWNKGSVVFASAMNNGNAKPNYPAACNHAVAVAATDKNDGLASFSNFGSWITVSAPGQSIATTARGGGYSTVAGTSFSSPITAGVAALMLSVNSSLSPNDLVNLLEQSTDDLGQQGFDSYFGWGRVNALKAVTAANNKSITVAVNPETATLAAGGGQQFNAVVTGASNKAVNWSVSPAIGSISASGFYSVPASLTGSQTVTVKAASVADPSKTASATINLTAAAISTVSVNPTALNGGSSATLTVQLNEAAPSGGMVVTLGSSNSSVASVPAVLNIPAGAGAGSVTVTTTAVASSTNVMLTASLGASTQTVGLTVNSANTATLQSVGPAVPTVVGGSTTNLIVVLTGTAPAGGASLSLASSNPAVASLAGTGVVAAGAKQASFPMSTYAVASPTDVVIVVTLGGATRSATVKVIPPSLVAAVSGPASISGGNAAKVVVSLNGPAPSNGMVATLQSSNPAVASMAPTGMIAAGATSGGFAVNTGLVAVNTDVTLSVTIGNVTRTAVLTVTPPTLLSVYAAPVSITGGLAAKLGVTLSGPAPVGGVTVTLASSNPAVASVAATGMVLTGASSMSFPVTTYPVAATTQVTLSITLGGVTRTAILTVTPAVP